jgi:ATP-dependent DNA helicase RecQ
MPLTQKPVTPQQILKQYWGYENFRPQQQQIIEAVLQGNNVLAILPTGGGKSICFQVPALIKPGLCLVISPLIALMKDQVENLRRKNITAFSLHAGMPRKEVIQTLALAANSNCKFLYVSPERLQSNLFKEYLPALNIQLVAVDEAHCISQWGYDFRPPYLQIAAITTALPHAPVLALTASATPLVQKDICTQLQFTSTAIFKSSFERSNLSYSVFNTDVAITKLVNILNNVPGSGIVYCKSRRRTKEIALQLKSYGISADFYHAGLTSNERIAKQEAWIKNKTRIMVCTNAFGMGIDKPDVKTVVHFDVPDCLENYYQEAGRAGRDGSKAFAVALYREKDIDDLQKNIELKFPALEIIQQVYQQIANYLQLPVNTGEGNYYDFDIADFMQKFKTDSLTVINVLKVLEQEGYVSFNEQVFIASKAQFICNKQTLYEFEENYADLEPLIKTLLRTYEGVFDHPVNIFEKQIAFTLKQEAELTLHQLKKLDSYGIIAYTPRPATPQLYFNSNRIKAEDIFINQQKYQQRKNYYLQRLQKLIDYLKDENTCRSKTIGNYFGDDAMKNCGVCDNCLRKKRAALLPAEFEKIEAHIINAVNTQQLNTVNLLKYLQHISKEKIWQVFEFMQAEHKLFVDEKGIITVAK